MKDPRQFTGGREPQRTYRVDVFAWGKWRGWADTRSLPDGYFTANLLSKANKPLKIEPDMNIRLASGNQVSWLRIPKLTGSVISGGKAFAGTGPSHAHLLVRISSDASETLRTTATGTKQSRYSIKLPHIADAGTSVEVYYAKFWDIIQDDWAARGIVAHEGSSSVTGNASEGQTLIFHVFNPDRRLIAAGATSASPTSGSFSVSVRNAHDQKIALTGGDTVVVGDGQTSTSYTLPSLDAHLSSNVGSTMGWTNARGRVHVTFYAGHDSLGEASSPISRKGAFRVNFQGVTMVPGTHIEVYAGSARSGEVSLDLPLWPASSKGSGTRGIIAAL